MLLRHNSRHGGPTQFSRALTGKHLPRAIAEQLHRPATPLGREAIESWLKEARRVSIAEAIQAYAEQAAGTAADLDEVLENASIEYLGSTEGHED